MISEQLSLPARRRAPSRAEAIGSWSMGGSFGRGFGALDGQKDLFYPTDLSGYYFFVNPDKYNTIVPGSTLKAGGSAPPVATLSGTKASRGAVRIEATSSTQFRWGYDNDGLAVGATATAWIQTGQTIPAGGSAFTLGSTGLAATFPSGTYASAQVWEETVASISSGSDVFSQATAAAQARLVKGTNGAYVMDYDGTDDQYYCSTIDLAAPSAGVPIWCWGFVKFTGWGGFKAIFSGGSDCWLRQITSTTIGMTCGADGNVATYAIGTPARYIAKFVGSTADSFKWGSASPVTGTNAANANSASGMWIGTLKNNPGCNVQGQMGALGIWNNVPAGTNFTDLEAWGAALYGSAPF